MNDTIEKLKAEQAEKLAKAIHDEEVKAEVFEALGFTDEKCFVYPLYSDCHIELEAETLPGALEMCERMNPLTIAHVRDGHLSFQPIDRLWHKNGENAEITAVGAYIYHIGYRQEKQLRFFVNAGQYIAEIRIVVKVDNLTRKDCKITYNHHGQARKHYCNLVNESGYFTKSVKWGAGSDETPNNFTLWVG